MNAGFMSEGVYIGEYTYREHVFHESGRRFPGYEYERYDGTDEADPFRTQGADEMAAKCWNNALLPEGHLRPGVGQPDMIDRADKAFSDEGDGCKTPTGARAVRVEREEGKYVAPQRRGRGRHSVARKLDLHAILSDAKIQAKYGFDSMILAQLRVIKESSATEAAAEAQKFLRERRNNYETVVKTDRERTYTRSEAMAELASYASMSTVRGGYLDAKIVLSKRSDTLHLLPAPYTKDAAEADEWEIMAPIAHAKHAVDYYRLVSVRGYDEAYILAGPAAAVLGISVVFTSPRLAMMHPSKVEHAAKPDVNASFDFSRLSVVRDAASTEIARATAPILRRGLHYSFTVAVSGKARLLNSHVRKEGTVAKYGGKELRKYQTYRLNGELWGFYDTAHDASLHGVARTRAPVTGERARVLIPTATGDVMATQWATIRPGRNSTWFYEVPDAIEVMQPGMSGAPVVAADGCVVGVHDGLTLHQAVFLPVPESVPGEIPIEMALDRRLAYGPPDSAHLALVEFDLRKRSKAYRTNNELVMHAMDCDGTRTVLSCYDVRAYLSGKSGDVAIPGLDFKLTSTGARGRSGALPVRAATAGERVVIVGKTEDGIYGTPVLCTQDVGASSLLAIDLCGDFGPSGFFNGALVVAIDDCMVVGFVSSQGVVSYGSSDTVVMAWKCHDLPIADELADQVADLRTSGVAGATSRPMTHRHSSSGASTSASSDMFTFSGVAQTVAGVESIDKLRTELAAAFPFVPISDVKKFPDAGLDEVFTHASMGAYSVSSRKVFSSNRYWARMGDAAMNYLINKQMFSLGVADDKATIIKSRVQNMEYQAKIARKFNLHHLIRHKRGVILSDHAVSDLLEALFGYIVESVGLESPIVAEMFQAIDMCCKVNDIYI